MTIFGKICVNCTAAAIGLVSLITVVTLVWVSLV
jgi:hypothetical protein